MVETNEGTKPYPVQLKRAGEESLEIVWSDGARHLVPWSVLRRMCPCAACMHQQAKPPTELTVLSPEQAKPPRPTSMKPVGRYAYAIEWSDGHKGGIYTIEKLRQIAEQHGSGPATD
jgi:DUF971 family protein